MQDYGPDSHSSKYQALDYKTQRYRETRWSKGCMEMLTLEAKIYSSCYSTADPSQYFIHHFLASWGHEGLSQLKSCPRDFWATLGARQGIVMWQDLYFNIPISVPYRQPPDLFQSRQNLKEAQKTLKGADLSKRSLLETHTATQCKIWGRDAICDIEIACTPHHFIVKYMGHELEASDLRKTTTSWGRGLGATSPTQDKL